jgi:hypothetical protein
MMKARCAIPAVICLDVEGKNEKAILRKLKIIGEKLLEETSPLLEREEVFEDEPEGTSNGTHMCVWPAPGQVEIDNIVEE